MRKPDFIIIGAPKCGTTALAEYLGEHPDVFISTPKEPHFFASDLPGYKGERTLEDYLSLFDNCGKEIKRAGEASVYYIFSREAIGNIFNFNPNSQLILMLRNPIDLVYSLHSQLLFSRNEDIVDFQKAWGMQKIRREGKCIPRYCSDPKVLQYEEVGKLGEQVARLLSSPFNREQVHVVFFEDFISNTRKVYEDTLRFLGLETDNRAQFPIVNPNTKHKVPWLGALYVNTPLWLSHLVRSAKLLTGVRQFNLSSKIAKLNTKVVKRPPMPLEVRHALKEVYRDDIALLCDLTGRDLTHWLD